MRFIHTADWHIGKKLHGYDLLEDQRAIIDQIIAIALEEKAAVIVIAGDLYDRSVPAVDAVKLLNEKIAEINLTNELPLLAISGNHDSPTRLETGSQWFQHVFICPPASNKVYNRSSLTIHNSFCCLILNRSRRVYFLTNR